MRLALPTLALLLFFGCSSGSSELDATSSDAALARDAGSDGDALPTDRGPLDALPDLDGSGSVDALGTDALAVDAGAVADSGNAEDTGAVADAGEIADAGEVADAGATDAGSMGCGALGRQCSMGVECGGNLACTNDRCFPVMPNCGGFAMARCPNTAPVCLYFAGADYGPCFTTAERNCLCSDPTLRLLFPMCP